MTFDTCVTVRVCEPFVRTDRTRQIVGGEVGSRKGKRRVFVRRLRIRATATGGLVDCLHIDGHRAGTIRTRSRTYR